MLVRHLNLYLFLYLLIFFPKKKKREKDKRTESKVCQELVLIIITNTMCTNLGIIKNSKINNTMRETRQIPIKQKNEKLCGYESLLIIPKKVTVRLCYMLRTRAGNSYQIILNCFICLSLMSSPTPLSPYLFQLFPLFVSSLFLVSPVFMATSNHKTKVSKC